jgi:hypothetical protein
MNDDKMGFYPIHDPEMPELVEALQFHIERLGHTYAHNADLDPMEGANRISAASDLFRRVTESLQELQEAGRVPAYNQEQRRAMLLKQVADWERMHKGGR